MCIIAKSLASQHPSQSLANDSKPAYGSNAKQLDCLFCTTVATAPLAHTSHRIFSKAAILCFTDHNACGDEGVQL